MNRPLIALAVLVALAGTAGNAWAGIISAVNVDIISPPSSVQKDGLTMLPTDNAAIFAERLNLTTTSDFTVDITAPGAYGSDPGNTLIGAGLVVDSYYLHFDVFGSGTGIVSGSVTFSTDVLAITGANTLLPTQTAQFGAIGTAYSDGFPPTADLAGIWDSTQDSVSLSADMRTVSFTLQVGNAPDGIRILTVPAPEPATAALFGLALVGAVRRRRRR